MQGFLNTALVITKKIGVAAIGISSTVIVGTSAIMPAEAMPEPQDSVLTPVGAVLANPVDGVNATATLVETADGLVITGAVSTNGADVFSSGLIGSFDNTSGFVEDTEYSSIATGSAGTQSEPGDLELTNSVNGSELKTEDQSPSI